jgi:Zn-dependent peptidase ImmA (M78 family)
MSQRIEEAIKELFRSAELLQAMEKLRVIPLNDLVGMYNLICTEITGLTSEVASNFLLQKGAIFNPLDVASKEPLAGYIYVGRSMGYIFVEKRDLLVRRRFSIAHELGHYVLHFLPLIEQFEQDGDEFIEIIEALSSPGEDEDAEELPKGKVYAQQTKLESLLPTYEQMEQEANQFAAELLMPEVIVRRLVEKYATDCRGDDLNWRLATEMLVSGTAMKRRLRELQLPQITGLDYAGRMERIWD